MALINDKIRKENNKISHLVCSTPNTPARTLQYKDMVFEENILGLPIRRNVSMIYDESIMKFKLINTELPLKKNLPIKKMHVHNSDEDSEINNHVENEKIKIKNSDMNDSSFPSKKNITSKRNSRINSDLNDVLIQTGQDNICLVTNSNENIPEQTIIVNNNKSKFNSCHRTKRNNFSKVKRSRIIHDSDECTSIKRTKQSVNSENMINNDNFSTDKEIKKAKEKEDNLKKKHVSNVNKTTPAHKINCKSARARISNQKLNKSIDISFNYDSDASILSKDMSLKSRKIAKQNFNSKMEIVHEKGKESPNRNANITSKNIDIEKERFFEDSNKTKSEENMIDNNTTLNVDKSTMTNLRRSSRIHKPRQSFWKLLHYSTCNLTEKNNQKKSEIVRKSNVSNSNKSTNLESPKKVKQNRTIKLKQKRTTKVKQNRTTKVKENHSTIVKQNIDCNDGSCKRKTKQIKSKSNKNMHLKQLLLKVNTENLSPISDSTKNSLNKNNKHNATIQDKMPSSSIIPKNKKFSKPTKKNSRKTINASTKSEIYLPNSHENKDKYHQHDSYKSKSKKNKHEIEKMKISKKNEDSLLHQNKVNDQSKNPCYIKKNIKKSKKILDIQNEKTKNLRSNKDEELHSTVIENIEDKVLNNSAIKENNENLEFVVENSNYPDKENIFDKIRNTGYNKKKKSTIRSPTKKNSTVKKLKINSADTFKENDFINPNLNNITDESDDTENLSTSNYIPVRKSRFQRKSQTIPEITKNKAVCRKKYQAAFANLNFSFKEIALKEQLPIIRKKGMVNITIEERSIFMECFGHFPQETYATKEEPYVSIAECFENNFCAGGIMEIKSQQTKKWDCALRHHLYFVILEGTAEVGIENMSRIMRLGDSFFVPTKSFYYIANLDSKKNLLINFVRYRCDFD